MSKKFRVEEPDDISDLNGMFSFSVFGKNIFKDLDKNGFQEVKTFSSVTKYENGKKVVDEQQISHFRNDGGEGFVNLEKIQNGEKKTYKKEFGTKKIQN